MIPSAASFPSPPPASMGFDISAASLLSPISTISVPLRRPVSRFLFGPGRNCRCSGNDAAAAGSPSVRSSGTRRWTNPLSQRNPPEIARQWVEADPPVASQDKFTVASYNILGDGNASKHWEDLYPDVPSAYLKWERRKRVICEELIDWDPDIICMQEVDKYSDLSDSLKRGRYVGSYKRRTGDTVDGCAIFWKENRFRLLTTESIEFKPLGLRDNVAQLAVFEMCRAESRRLVVGNIHVLFRPSRGDVKLGQIGFLSTRAHSLSKKWGNIPVLLAGDFNTTPQSAVYKFLSTSQLDILSYDRRELSGQRSCHPSQVFGQNGVSSSAFITMDRWLNSEWSEEELKTAGGNAGVVTHPLKLNSSYATINASAARDSKGEPIATSYHSKFFGTVDYIWYTEGLEPTRVLDTPAVDVLRRTGGLPCEKLGSDHLALVSEFAFTDQSES